MSAQEIFPVVEVDCGASLLAEVLAEQNEPLDLVTLTDISPRMIAYSKRYEEMRAQLVVAPADDLPLPTGSQRSVVSCLGDPYNDPGFWSEARRVLKPGGQVFYTTPSFEWANRFRAFLPPTLQSKAEFVTSEERRVWIPSKIVTEENQKLLIESAGFRLLELKHVPLGGVPQPISSKLGFLGREDEPVLTGYIAERL